MLRESSSPLDQDHVIGIDLGTSSLKLVLMSADGVLQTQASAALSVQSPQPAWCEQNPADWWAALEQALQALRERSAPSRWARVRAIAVAGQMHGAVLLDDIGQVLRPAILWNDGRAQVHCAQLESREPDARWITANRAMAGFTAPKLMWLAEHEPDCFARVATVLLPKDWIVWRLTGELASDCSDAAGTLWLDVGARRWSEAMLSASGMRLEQMPRLHESPEVVGTLAASWASRWGLPQTVRVAAGAGDNAAGALGMGVVEPGDGLLSRGTSGVVFVPAHAPSAKPERGVHTFCHALPGLWHQMSVMLSAASALHWWASLCGCTPAAVLSELTMRPRESHPDDAPIFLPYLAGERTPHADPGARAAFLGVHHGHGRADLGRAVLEGVAMGLADGLTALHEAGARPCRLLAVGGGSQSDLWLQMMADLSGLPIARAAGADVGPAQGAARLALLALGHPRAAVLSMPRVQQVFEPDARERECLLSRWSRFKAAWRPVRELQA